MLSVDSGKLNGGGCVGWGRMEVCRLGCKESYGGEDVEGVQSCAFVM